MTVGKHGVADAVIAAARGAPTLADRAKFYEKAIEQGVDCKCPIGRVILWLSSAP